MKNNQFEGENKKRKGKKAFVLVGVSFNFSEFFRN